MSVSPDVKQFLSDHAVEYEVIPHPAAYTTQEEAAATHISGYEWAKTVIFFKEDGEAIMAVVPAPYDIDVEALEALVDGGELELAEESEFAHLYPDCEPGAMPPLGTLYEQRVYVDERLSGDEEIVFNAGSHTEAIRMSYADFDELVHPVVGGFARSHEEG